MVGEKYFSKCVMLSGVSLASLWTCPLVGSTQGDDFSTTPIAIGVENQYFIEMYGYKKIAAKINLLLFIYYLNFYKY
jgi:hypothetical protein